MERFLDHLVWSDCSCVLSRERSTLRMCPSWRARVIQAASIKSSRTSRPTSPRLNWKLTKSSSARQASLSLALHPSPSESYRSNTQFSSTKVTLGTIWVKKRLFAGVGSYSPNIPYSCWAEEGEEVFKFPHWKWNPVLAPYGDLINIHRYQQCIFEAEQLIERDGDEMYNIKQCFFWRRFRLLIFRVLFQQTVDGIVFSSESDTFWSFRLEQWKERRLG